MSDTHSHDDHWRRLAEELGLDVGPAPEQPSHAASPEHAAADEAVAPPPWPEPVEDEPARDFSERGDHRRQHDWPTEAQGDGLEPTDIEEPTPLPSRRGHLAHADDLFPADAEVSESDDSGIETAAGESVAAEDRPESTENGADEQPGKRRRRRRSRRKKKDEPAGTGADNGGELVSGENLGEMLADDEEEPTAEVVRNWNVPSWDDLIASLHRPER